MIPAPIVGTSQRSFGTALRDVFGNDFKTWSVQLQVSYPIGTSPAEAALAQAGCSANSRSRIFARLELQVTAQVRDAAAGRHQPEARRGHTQGARVRRAPLEAEQKRMTVGLSTTFQLFQAQRDLASARLAELNAIIAYNRSLVNFEPSSLHRSAARAARQNRGFSLQAEGLEPTAACDATLGGATTGRPACPSEIHFADVKLTVTVITHNEAGAHRRGTRIGRLGRRDHRRRFAAAPTTPSRSRERCATRVEVRDWPGYSAQKNYAARLASNDWILSLDADERVTPALAAEIRALHGTASRPPAATASRASRCTSAGGSESPTGIRDYQLRLYDRRAGTWNGRRGARVGRAAMGRPGLLRHELQHYAYRDISRPPRHDRSLHDAGRGAVDGRRPAHERASRSLLHPPLAFLRNYVAARRIRRRHARACSSRC